MLELVLALIAWAYFTVNLARLLHALTRVYYEIPKGERLSFLYKCVTDPFGEDMI